MAYARRQKIGASRTFAIAVVALTQASLGYALVNGLAYTVVQGPSDGLKIFTVQEEERAMRQLYRNNHWKVRRAVRRLRQFR